MLSKLLKKDLNKNMRWLWILFTATIVVSGITRGCKELGKSIAFFQVLGVFFDSVFYALAVNVILQPFLKNFINFSNSFYSDESYLTHTLPVTKKQLINSKYLTALIEIILGFECLILSILIMFASPSMPNFLKMIISTIIADTFSLGLFIVLFISLIIVEFLMYISIIFFSIVIANKSKEKRKLKAFLLTVGFAFAALAVLSIFIIVILLINDIKFTTSTLILTNTTFVSVILTGIIVYSLITLLFYILTQKEFNKGVNVD